MSNQIRPTSRVFDPKDPVILEIAVESAVSSYTWVGFVETDGGDEVPVFAGWRPRSGTRKAPAEVSVTLTENDLLPDGAALINDYRAADGRPPLDFIIRLYAGRPGSLDEVEAFTAANEPLDQDAFSIAHQSPTAAASEPSDIGAGPLRVALVRPEAPKLGAEQSPVTYKAFREYLDQRNNAGGPYDKEDAWPAYGSEPYLALRNAARDFVATRKITDFQQLIPPGYLSGKLEETRRQFPTLPLPPAEGRGAARTSYLPAVELIWNYWLEEGMLVQTLNVILARFQNRRIPGRDPLGRFDVTPLLTLRNKLWGYTEDEIHRMTVRRRAVEYEYEYGFALIGRAVPPRQQLVERRSGFLQAFHQVLFLANQYFKEYDDLTVQADAFPLYRALRDCHIVLSQGTQNQYGEMAVAARAEFLVMQSILAEPQMREFLGGRPMTPYPEEWMDRVDAMKAIQGWTDTSIMNFNDLATIGEQLVLTIRLGNWADTGVGATHAANWAAAFRSGIQQYTAAYRTATGADLSREANTEMPSTLLARKLAGNRIRA